MADIGDLDQIVRNYLINDTVGISRRQERPIPSKGIEHGRTNLGVVAKEFELCDDLILKCERQHLKLCLRSWEKFNPSWHVSPVWP